MLDDGPPSFDVDDVAVSAGFPLVREITMSASRMENVSQTTSNELVSIRPPLF
jgi:hypothetical protein